jgi:hypothetical protein
MKINLYEELALQGECLKGNVYMTVNLFFQPSGHLVAFMLLIYQPEHGFTDKKYFRFPAVIDKTDLNGVRFQIFFFQFKCQNRKSPFIYCRLF